MLVAFCHQSRGKRRLVSLFLCCSLVRCTTSALVVPGTFRNCDSTIRSSSRVSGVNHPTISPRSSFCWLQNVNNGPYTITKRRTTARLYHCLPLPGLLVPEQEKEPQQNETDTQDNNDETYQVALRNTFWSVAMAILFGTGLWLTAGPKVGQEFFAGYIVEKSLSVDNLFVFLLLFDNFQIPPEYQNRILTWGIYGSVLLRALMISLGATALHGFRGILLVFAGILIYSAVQVLVDVEEEIEHKSSADSLQANPVVWVARHLCGSNDACDVDSFEAEAKSGQTNPVILFSQSLFPSTSAYDGDRFFIVDNEGIRRATPIFVCMVAVELSDVVFAVDSIPAVFGVTEVSASFARLFSCDVSIQVTHLFLQNPFVVFSSNMFAILGLRSLYPVLSKAALDLKYLEPTVAVILAFIGGKMIAEYWEYTISTEMALSVILSLLGLGVAASLWDKEQQEKDALAEQKGHH